MLKPHSSPYGYKKLLAYKKAEELQSECRKLTATFPKSKTLIDLADQMDRSARSGKQNIVEGWKRNSTKEYDDFLGFSIGAIAELEEDCDDIWKGVYPELENIKGAMGGKGGKGAMGGRNGKGIMGEKVEMGKRKDQGEKGTLSSPLTPQSHQPSSSPLTPPSPSIHPTHSSHQSHSTPLTPFAHLDIEKLKFYPLDQSLPQIVQLKLRCKELNFLLGKLQRSLESKMTDEGTMTTRDKMRINNNARKKEDSEYLKLLEKQGLARAEDGRIVEKES